MVAHAKQIVHKIVKYISMVAYAKQIVHKIVLIPKGRVS